MRHGARAGTVFALKNVPKRTATSVRYGTEETRLLHELSVNNATGRGRTGRVLARAVPPALFLVPLCCLCHRRLSKRIAACCLDAAALHLS